MMHCPQCKADRRTIEAKGYVICALCSVVICPVTHAANPAPDIRSSKIVDINEWRKAKGGMKL